VKHPIWTAAAMSLLAVALMIWGLYPAGGAPEASVPMIALVLDTDLGFGPAVIRRGAQLAAREFKVELSSVAPSGGEAPDRQIELIREQVDAGAPAILLVPASEGALAAARRLCAEEGVALVVLDAYEAARGDAPYVGADHGASGAQAAEALLEAAGGVKVGVFYSDDRVCAERLRGVRQALARAGAEASFHRLPADGSEPTDDAVSRLIAETSAGAILCLNGALTESAARAIEAQRLKGRVTLAGFDCDQTRVQLLESGAVRFTVLGKPLATGYLGVGCAADLLNNRAVPSVTHTGAAVIMSEDILKPENVQLVFPLIQ